MFKRFVKRPSVLKRYEQAPFAVERKRFLKHLSKLEYSHTRLMEFNVILLAIAKRVDIRRGEVTKAVLSRAAKRWLKSKTEPGTSKATVRHFFNEFVCIGSRWLRFLGRFDDPIIRVPFSDKLDEFATALRQEHGFSAATVEFRRRSVKPFLVWLNAHGGCLAKLQPTTFKEYFVEHQHRHWKRRTLVAYVQSLRAFLQFGASRGWCPPDLAKTIERPRIYTHELLPQGPSWSEVQRLIASVDGDQPAQIRDRAVILLLAVYGFRIGEVTALSLEDFDWENERIRLSRSKRRTRQEYPLMPVVGEAVLRYLREARPKSRYRNIFLRVKAPHHPLRNSSLGSQVSHRIRDLGISFPHFGPHVLRHSCATHLLSKGFSLHEIGNHLGHHAARSAQTYAKVDYSSLRTVADRSLKEVIAYTQDSPLKLHAFPLNAQLIRLREVGNRSLGGLL
jgi:site-specific recombinase XerD